MPRYNDYRGMTFTEMPKKMRRKLTVLYLHIKSDYVKGIYTYATVYYADTVDDNEYYSVTVNEETIDHSKKLRKYQTQIISEKYLASYKIEDYH